MTGVEPIDLQTIYAALRDVQQLRNQPSQISNIAISLVEIVGASELADRWGLLTRDRVESRDQTNANFLSVVKTQDISLRNL